MSRLAMTDSSNIDTHRRKELTASIVAVTLPCLILFPWVAVLAVAAMFIVATWRCPAMVFPMFCTLGAATVVSQSCDALNGDIFSRWWIAILISWLIVLFSVAVFDKQQIVLGVVNRCLVRYGSAVYFLGACARILFAAILSGALLLAALRWESSILLYSFLLSLTPMTIVLYFEGVKMLRLHRRQTSWQ